MISPDVNLFEYEILNLNPSLNLTKVLGVPSLPYTQIPPEYINTNIDKARNVINHLNCNNVHYEICKEGDLDVGLVFEYNENKKPIIPFTNFRNMLYYATFNEKIELCYIERIKKFSNGNVIGEFIPVYEELHEKFRISEFSFKDYSLNCITDKWTYEYNTTDIEKTISVKEYTSTDGLNFVFVQEIVSTDLLNNIHYEVQVKQSYYSNNILNDVQVCVFDYKNRFVGFDRANSNYMRFSFDDSNRVKLIAYKKDWNVITKCNLYYFSDDIIDTNNNSELKINCEEYFGVQKRTYSYINIITDSSKPNINAFTDFKDYGLEFIDFSRKHQYITEIQYFNELNILVKKANPVYRPDYLIDSLIFSELSDEGSEYLHSGILNYYYDLNHKLSKVIEFKNEKILELTVTRKNDVITSYKNELILENSLELTYKPGSNLLDKVLKVNANITTFWYKICYGKSSTGNVANIPQAVYFVDNHTVEAKILNKCRGSIVGVQTDEELINTKKIVIDDYNSLEYIYDYEGPKVERFFIDENDWSFVDNLGTQSYLKYIIVKKNGAEYFCIPKYKDNGSPNYVDLFEKISDIKTGTFIKRIEFLDTMGKEEALSKKATYHFRYAIPYIDTDGVYQHSENKYAITMSNYVSDYIDSGYFDDNYLIPSKNGYSSLEVFEPCIADECVEFYWGGDYTSDLDYITMCSKIIPPCLYPYIDDDYLIDTDNYILCPKTVASCMYLYVEQDYVEDTDKYILCPSDM